LLAAAGSLLILELAQTVGSGPMRCALRVVLERVA